MKRGGKEMYWEHAHKCLDFNDPGVGDDVNEEIGKILRNFDLDGFELVTVLPHDNGYDFFFKRPANPENIPETEDYRLPST
jgi:hypothetical protein